MDKAPLVEDEIEAGRELIERLNDSAAVLGACWLRWDEDGERYLYIAIDAPTESEIDAAYLEVLRITTTMTDHYMDPFRVNLVKPTDRVAQALEEIYRRFPARVPSRLSGPAFGRLSVAEVYIYPQLQSQKKP